MAKKAFSVPRGTSDILPDDMIQWNDLEEKARNILGCYGYREMRTPIFEETELFARSVGQASDIVQKQMLNLAAQGDKAHVGDMTVSGLSLRPEGTASIVRSYIENRFDRAEKLSKLFYIGPMFRGERPQKGRLRQFHQIGVEAIGPESASPYLDAELIALSVDIINSFGIDDVILKLNTLGTKEDKKNFSDYLKQNIGGCLSKLCPDCLSRYERNVFRVLDCKNKNCKAALKGLVLDHSYLSQDSRDYYGAVKAALNILGVSYQEVPSLVRGLDYYTHVVFEVSCPKLGSQDAIGAGGRYNQLVEDLGGLSADAMGFALGIERMLLATSSLVQEQRQGIDLFVVVLEERFFPRALQILKSVRCQGVRADMSFIAGSMKSQMRQANKLNARHVAIIGEEEFNRGILAVKNMNDGSQQEFSLEDLDELIKKVKT